MTGKPVFRIVVVGLSQLFSIPLARSQEQTSAPQASASRPSDGQNPAPAAAVGTIHGTVTSGNVPIPGAEVSISMESSSTKISTWTDVDGTYSTAIANYGNYTVRVQMVAFANSSQHVVVDSSHSTAQANFGLILLSRATAAQKTGGAGDQSARISESFDPAGPEWTGHDGGTQQRGCSLRYACTRN